MKSSIKNILIGLAIVAVMLGAYFYFSKNPGISTKPLTVSTNANTAIINKNIAEDTAFLSTLIGLSSIKIDTAIFTNKSFSSLVDNTVLIGNVTEVSRRSNPFAPLETQANPNTTAVDSSKAIPSTIINSIPTSTPVPAANSSTSSNTSSILKRSLDCSDRKQ
mgnify:CR=1 FL=1